MKQNNYLLIFISILFIVALVNSGCKENGVEPENLGQNTFDDAAESVAAAIGDTIGGMWDLIGDFSEMATNNVAFGSGTFTNAYIDTEKIRPEDTIWARVNVWRGTLNRTKGSPTDSFYVTTSRTYEWYFEKDTIIMTGTPPTPTITSLKTRNYIVGSDTARRVFIKVLSGTAYAFTPRLKQSGTSYVGTAVIITKANTDTLRINGTIIRSATDSLSSQNISRVLTNQIVMNLANITSLRTVGRTTLSVPTVTGTFKASVLFPQGQQQYADINFKRAFVLNFNAGTATINIIGVHFIGGNSYSSDILRGTLFR